MSYDRSDYWREAVEIALSEAGVAATPEQIKEIGWAIEGSAENIGQAFHTPESPYPAEIEKLKRELRAEENKVHCRTCNGSGRIVTQGPYHSSNSGCYKCNGEGRHAP